MNTEAAVYSSVHLRERDKLLSEKHQKEIAVLEKKLQKAKSIGDETAKQLFDAVNRGRKLARSLGFEDVYDAQFAVDSVDHEISFRECYDRLQRLDDRLVAEKKDTATLETKMHDAEEKVRELQKELEARTLDKRLKSTESSLREQLRRLSEQYDALKVVKERAAERYKADFKKWRAFKDWLFAEDTEHHKHRNEAGVTLEEKKQRDRASIMRKKQKVIEIGPDLAQFEGEPEDGDEGSLSILTIHNGLTPALTNAEGPPPLGRVEMDSDKENEGIPVPHKKRRISTTKDKGKSREAQADLATPTTTRTSDQKRIGDYSAFKGRGRYGTGAENDRPGDTTINAQYAIDANQNEGVNYQYDIVVRNRDERRRLDGGDCECCREYYEGVGPLPSRLQPPLWCSPPPTPTRPCLRQSHPPSPKAQHPPESRTRNKRRPQTGPTPDLHRQSDIESHKKAISRHRHAWARAKTPPGYWEIGFPDTQAVQDINEKAKQMHKRKKAEIDKEAENEAGRYRRR